MGSTQNPKYSKQLPDRLLLSRRDLHWNQADLAEKSGVSRGHISNIERGHTTNVTIDVVYSLAEALKVSPYYLLGDVEDPLFQIEDIEKEDEFPIRSTGHPDPFVEELVKIYQQLDPQQRSTLLNIAKVLRAADEPRIIGSE